MTKFYNKYFILSNRDTNIPPILDQFPEGFHQISISDNKFEVDLDSEYKIDLTNKNLAKSNDNIYCHLSRHWFVSFNKDRYSYHYDCSATFTGISYKAMKDFNHLNEYNINE
jgi:hypothetical protein